MKKRNVYGWWIGGLTTGAAGSACLGHSAATVLFSAVVVGLIFAGIGAVLGARLP